MKKLILILPLALVLYVMVGCQDKDAMAESEKMKNLPNPCVALSCIVIGNRIYAVGGSIREWPFKPVGTVEVFEFNE